MGGCFTFRGLELVLIQHGGQELLIAAPIPPLRLAPLPTSVTRIPQGPVRECPTSLPSPRLVSIPGRRLPSPFRVPPGVVVLFGLPLSGAVAGIPRWLPWRKDFAPRHSRLGATPALCPILDAGATPPVEYVGCRRLPRWGGGPSSVD